MLLDFLGLLIIPLELFESLCRRSSSNCSKDRLSFLKFLFLGVLSYLGFVLTTKKEAISNETTNFIDSLRSLKEDESSFTIMMYVNRNSFSF